MNENKREKSSYTSRCPRKRVDFIEISMKFILILEFFLFFLEIKIEFRTYSSIPPS